MPHDHPDHDHAHPHSHSDERVPHDDSKRERVAELTRGAGAGKLLFLDAFSGIAGDMLVAALVDLGVPQRTILEPLSHLPISGYEIHFERRSRSNISGLGFDVRMITAQPSRTYAEIRALLEHPALTDGARAVAKSAFSVLAQAEAAVHDSTLDDVHFHEVGAIDSIVDIIAASIALDYLGADVVCSPLPMGRGFVRAAHGFLPLPAPATVACLAGIPTYDAGIDSELVTPTGACLVRATAKSFARWPAIAPERIGWGAGTRELADRPNLLRAVLGLETAKSNEDLATHCVIELNVDDLSGELLAVAVSAAFEAGALDAWTTPIGMKKGRPAVMLSALTARAKMQPVAQALLRESSSLGVRVRDVTRIERPRRMIEVETEFGTIAMKVADGDGLPELASPEHEACRTAAISHRVPVRQVYASAIAAYWRTRPHPHRGLAEV